ncbi:MAG: radical SAM protein [Candidatus Omnitrophica bacterium]|nr:radical SAM protein [Candidatus Omnitrophota bacterium]
MKVAILNPSYGDNFVRVARWAARSRGRVQRHPEYLLTAAQVLLDRGHEVIFVEAAARNLPLEESLRIINDFKPDLLLIHATTPSIYADIKQAAQIKRLTGCKTAFAGQHVTAEAQDTFTIGAGVVDYILRAEYDLTLRDLADGRPIPDIAGLAWRNGDQLVNNPDRPLLDVTSLPFPAWQLIKPEWYPDAGKRYPFLTLMTGRGCNNACSFCRDPQLMYGHHLRNRTALQVVDEMAYGLKLFPQIREIMFETDTFGADPEHVRQVCAEIMRRGIHKKISWSCNMRVNTDLKILPVMRQSNCRMLMVGFEFGTNEALRSIRKGGVSIEMGRTFANTAHKLGFTIHGCFMVGAPGETRASARTTIDYAKSLPLDTMQITGIATYPGTALYKWAKENGHIQAKDWNDWLTPEGEQRTLVSYPQFSAQDINRYVDIGLKEFYLRPGQILKMLFTIRSIGDLLRKAYGFGAFLDYFLKKALGQKKTADPS